jgi:hypothetical protein
MVTGTFVTYARAFLEWHGRTNREKGQAILSRFALRPASLDKMSRARSTPLAASMHRMAARRRTAIMHRSSRRAKGETLIPFSS